MWVYIWSNEWLPWANTVAYYPLDSTNTTNDMKGSWTAYNLTNNWSVTFWTYNWVSCAYFNWWTWKYLTNASLSFWAYPQQTVSIWFYTTSTDTTKYQVIYNIWTVSQNWLLGSWYKHNTLWISLSSWHSSYEVSQNINLSWWWHLLTNVTNWSVSKQYIDWVFVQTFNNSLSQTQTRICFGNTIYWSNTAPDVNQFSWYLSKCIVEDICWSAQEILDYYNQTKSIYWLS